MGLLTWDRIEGLGEKLDIIEKHLTRLEVKVDTIIKEDDSIRSIEANIAEIKNQILELKK